MATLSTNSIFSTRSLQRRISLGFRAFFALKRQRHALAKLDATRLEDLGIAPLEAAIEAEKPIWDVPNHWHR